jgi:hypothetical protein
VTAWRAIEVWDSERVLFIDYDGPHPHTVMAQICEVGGLMVHKLAVLKPGAATAWDKLREGTEVPMPIRRAPVTDVLGDLAHALRATDMTWPRNDDEDFLDNRALAWSRCRDHLPDWPDHTELPEPQRRQLISDFAADSGCDDEVSRSLAELLLDYGEGYIGAGHLCWSPGEVMLLLTDWLPRKIILDADQRAALPDVLRAWLRFTLTQRNIDPNGSAPTHPLGPCPPAGGWGAAQVRSVQVAPTGVLEGGLRWRGDRGTWLTSWRCSGTGTPADPRCRSMRH